MHDLKRILEPVFIHLFKTAAEKGRLLQPVNVNTIAEGMQKCLEQREADEYAKWSAEYISGFNAKTPVSRVVYNPEPVKPRKEPEATSFYQTQRRSRTVVNDNYRRWKASLRIKKTG